jgi:hypothetical protein
VRFNDFSRSVELVEQGYQVATSVLDGAQASGEAEGEMAEGEKAGGEKAEGEKAGGEEGARPPAGRRTVAPGG